MLTKTVSENIHNPLFTNMLTFHTIQSTQL